MYTRFVHYHIDRQALSSSMLLWKGRIDFQAYVILMSWIEMCANNIVFSKRTRRRLHRQQRARNLMWQSPTNSWAAISLWDDNFYQISGVELHIKHVPDAKPSLSIPYCAGIRIRAIKWVWGVQEGWEASFCLWSTDQLISEVVVAK